MTGAAVPGTRVTYIIGDFPVRSQRFILREVLAVKSLGADVVVHALRRPDADWLEADEREVLDAVSLLPPLLSWSTLTSHAHFLRRAPRRYFATLGTLLALPRRRWYLVFRLIDAFLRAPHIGRRLLTGPGPVHVHAHFALRATEVAMAVAELTGGTFSFTAHAYDIYRIPNALEEKLRRARFVVTCTHANAAYLKALCPDVPASRIAVVYHGVEVDGAAEATPPIGVPLILSAGRLIEKKGLDSFIAACGSLARQGVAFDAAIAGEGPLRGRLEELINAAGLQGRVRLLGWRSYRELVTLYRQAAVFVLPSRITEDGDRDGIPNVLIEALLHRVPVISTAVSAIPELVRDGETGQLIAPDDPAALTDALRRVLADPAAARATAEAGRVAVLRDFDPRRNAARLLELLRCTDVTPGIGAA